MVTIHTLHLISIGIFFLVVSQVAPFQEPLLVFMLIFGIILVILGIIFRIVRTIGLKIKKTMSKTGTKQILMSTNYYFSYFLIALAFVSTLVGFMTMPNIAI